jgi:dihydroorotate dehydrogenase electron transfer subunit
MNAPRFQARIEAPYKKLKISDMHWKNNRTTHIVLNEGVKAVPGQFVMVWLPGIGEKPYSLVNNDPIELLIVDVGFFSHSTRELKPGDFIWLRGPYGNGYKLLGRSALLIAGGYGIAPLSFLADRARKKEMQFEVCIGAKVQEDLVFEEKFLFPNVDVFISTEDGSKGQKGLITDIAMQRLKEFCPDAMYGCGPRAMMEKMVDLGNFYRIPTQLSWEAYMRCGIGVCGSCELEHHGKATGQLVCSDGPVFQF